MKIIATNRRARYDYQISDKLVAGIVLSGAEVKSVKAGHVSLKGSFATINRGELWLLNTHISPYSYAKTADYDETRTRKLLVHKQELERLRGQQQAGQSVVPLAMGLERGLVKVELGIGRGLKKFDKREVKKQRQAEREIGRRLSRESGRS